MSRGSRGAKPSPLPHVEAMSANGGLQLSHPSQAIKHSMFHGVFNLSIHYGRVPTQPASMSIIPYIRIIRLYQFILAGIVDVLVGNAKSCTSSTDVNTIVRPSGDCLLIFRIGAHLGLTHFEMHPEHGTCTPMHIGNNRRAFV
jgi:hypothetical protein